MEQYSKSAVPLARDVALNAHKDLLTYTISGYTRPQILHLQEVADLVWASGGTDEEIAAAWLHDSIEDTPMTLAEIEVLFGKELAMIVHGLTDPEEFSRLPLGERKQKQAARIRGERHSVKRVKIADQTSNIRSLIDPTNMMSSDEWSDYLEGARLIANECAGISATLDELFLKTYQEGKKIYEHIT
jgi:guanosine-3',5'-bis(diphosphate) 3'-pyrophosphohydrolase